MTRYEPDDTTCHCEEPPDDEPDVDEARLASDVHADRYVEVERCPECAAVLAVDVGDPISRET